jgi:hypothetical protein
VLDGAADPVRKEGMNLRLLKSWLFCSAALLPIEHACAENVAAADARLIRMVVQSQLKALSENDAIRAFALATPEARSEIGSPENLLRIVKEKFDPLYHCRLAIFMKAESEDGDVTQTVRITDDEDHVWLAVYDMELESDGSWEIGGWELLETDTISI